MKSGREVDIDIALDVMKELDWSSGDYHAVPQYSTDIAAAWDIADKVRSMGFEIELCGDADGWRCLVVNYPEAGYCEAESAPLAICLAALEAAGVEVGDA